MLPLSLLARLARSPLRAPRGMGLGLGMLLLLQALPTDATEAWIGPANHRDVHDLGQQSNVGAFHAWAIDPGFAHEPNHPGDSYPAIESRGSPTREGFHTSYAGYAQALPRLFVDMQPRRVVNALRPEGPLATASPGFGQSPGPGGEDRPLEAAAYVFRGAFGVWHDQSHDIVEHTSTLHALDPLLGTTTVRYSVAPDGWVGNIVKTTGTWWSAGWGFEVCPSQGQEPAPRPYGNCHPYMDGSIADPNNYADSEGEFVPACSNVVFARTRSFVVAPREPTGLEVAVVRGYAAPWRDPATPPGAGPSVEWRLLDGPIHLALGCRDGVLETLDLLVLPQGNRGTGLTTHLTLDLTMQVRECAACPWRMVDEVLTDVDGFHPWGYDRLVGGT